MARASLSLIVLKPLGFGRLAAAAGASVQVNLRTGGAASVYSAETAGSVLLNPLTSDAQGRVTGWVERGAYNLAVSHPDLPGGGYTAFFDAAPGGNATIDGLWLPGGILTEEDLFATGYHQPTIPATNSFPIFVAPFALRVKQAAIVVWNSSITADDTNYWRFAIRRTRAGAAAEIASKSTQLTGGQALTSRTEWNFDAAVFSATNGLISKGDIVDLAAFMTGAPTNLVATTCTVRYEPV
jgi:hypothetical protein